MCKVNCAVALLRGGAILACAITLSACNSWLGAVHAEGVAEALQVEFLNVGQGNASLLRMGSRSMLLDAGPDSAGLLDSLHARGIDSLDWVLLTHGHRDHCGGLWEIIGKIGIGHIWLGRDTTHPWGMDSVGVLARRARIAIDTLTRGDTLPGLAPWKASILWPMRTLPQGDNAASLAVWVGDHSASVLWVGDLGFAQEERLLQLEPTLHADVLQVGHHGSATSSSLEFVGRLGLKWAVISVGENPWGHPRQETIDRLNAVLGDSTALLRTDRDGAVQFELLAVGIAKL